MPRETKEQRLAREQAEHERIKQEFIDLYPERLMSALERATTHGWNIEVRNRKFVVSYYDEHNDRESIELEYTVSEYNSWGPIDDLESELHRADLREAEYKRKQALRQSAIAKLTPEEREELGLRPLGYQ